MIYNCAKKKYKQNDMQCNIFEIKTHMVNLPCNSVARFSVRSIVECQQECFDIHKEQTHQHLFHTPYFSEGYIVSKYKCESFNQDEIRPKVHPIRERIG